MMLLLQAISQNQVPAIHRTWSKMMHQIYDFFRIYSQYIIYHNQIKDAEKFIIPGLLAAMIANKDAKIGESVSTITELVDSGFENASRFCSKQVAEVLRGYDLAIHGLGLDESNIFYHRIKAVLRVNNKLRKKLLAYSRR